MSFSTKPSMMDALDSTEQNTNDSKTPSDSNPNDIDKNVTTPENNVNVPSDLAAATQLLDLRSNEGASNVHNEPSHVCTTSMAIISTKRTKDNSASSKRKKLTIEESSDSDTDYSASKQDSVVLRKGKTSDKPTSQRSSNKHLKRQSIDSKVLSRTSSSDSERNDVVLSKTESKFKTPTKRPSKVMILHQHQKTNLQTSQRRVIVLTTKESLPLPTSHV